MERIIIFTRIDDDTNEYFRNFGIECLKINEVNTIIFINEKFKERQIIEASNNLFTTFQEDLKVYVFYHISANHFDRHQSFIRTHIPNNDFTEIEDHHNYDGLHCEYIMRASMHYANKNLIAFRKEINNLINEINNNDGN